MAKVYGIHEIELHPGADPAAFEQLCAEGSRMGGFAGWKSILLKGERGARKGKYTVLIEIDSLAARDRYAPDSGPTAEAQAVAAQAGDFWERWQQFTAILGEGDIFTDYVVVE